MKNAKIRTKVITAFGIIILLATGVVIWLLFGMNSLAGNTQQLYNQPYAASNDMWTIRRNLIDTERVLYKLTGTGTHSEAIQSANATLTKDAEDIQGAISSLSNILTAPEETKLLEEIKSFLTQGSSIREQIMSLLSAGSSAEAGTLLSSEYEPIFEQCNDKVLELFQITEQDAAEFALSSQSSARGAIIAGLLLLIGGVITALIVSISFSKSITRPIEQIDRAAKEMAGGNLGAAEFLTYQSRDELGQLSESLRFTMTTLHAYVEEISGILIQISRGDLTVPQERITDYLGDFSQIKRSFVTILGSFNHTLGEISQSADQVNSGSGQVAGASQLLSQGATEQSHAIVSLTATVEEISGHIRQNADSAESASKLTEKVSSEVEESNKQMQRMNEAMAEIGSSSQEISKIISTIENIAFQTNILALNAAVEAARAGAAGKGFAVVADEVRSLASKSAEASKSTSSLIQNSVRAVENGTAIAAATAASLETVAATTRQVVETVDHIADASEKQARSVELVTTQVSEISSVVQTNSATAEESAAASEELSGQAKILDQLVGRFRLASEHPTPERLPAANAELSYSGLEGKY